MPEPLPPFSLEGEHVRLEPLAHHHAPALVAAANADRSSFDLTWVPDGLSAMEAYIADLLAHQQRGRVIPFAQVRTGSGEVVGCTRYLDLHHWRGRAEPDEIEIGGTWLGARAQRTPINTEAKLLLLGHAFETLGVWRVAICTDVRNQRSRDAIERLGVRFEGVLRNHRLRSDADGAAPRDTALYAATSDDWPTIKAGLTSRLASPRQAPAT